jgi:hypothetical protein
MDSNFPSSAFQIRMVLSAAASPREPATQDTGVRSGPTKPIARSYRQTDRQTDISAWSPPPLGAPV